MARLNQEQWRKVQSDYSTGKYTNRELAVKHNTTHTSIQNHARDEGWQKVDRVIVDNLVKAKVDMHSEVSKLSKVSKLDAESFNSAINDIAQFEIDSNRDMQLIQDQMNGMVGEIERPSDALALMNATVKHREARLGKNPDTAIQINNTAPTAITRTIVRNEPRDTDT